LMLARARDPKTQQFLEGSRGLSVFFAEMRNPDGNLNGVRIHRLKEKFGTKAVPTAELELENMRARLVGPLHRGIPTIASILNITRMHCAIGVCGGLSRALAISKEFARVREVGWLCSLEPRLPSFGVYTYRHKANDWWICHCIHVLWPIWNSLIERQCSSPTTVWLYWVG
jgi:alkylation response protein AidB-like acyl-CoA dehydrogenase